jgi:hypothetical protein
MIGFAEYCAVGVLPSHRTKYNYVINVLRRLGHMT